MFLASRSSITKESSLISKQNYFENVCQPSLFIDAFLFWVTEIGSWNKVHGNIRKAKSDFFFA